MRQITRVCAATLLCAFTMFAQSDSKTNGDESKIIALENVWNQMQIKHDAAAMEQIVDADFVLTDFDGTVLSKRQFLASIKDPSYVSPWKISGH